MEMSKRRRPLKEREVMADILREQRRIARWIPSNPADTKSIFMFGSVSKTAGKHLLSAMSELLSGPHFSHDYIEEAKSEVLEATRILDRVLRSAK